MTPQINMKDAIGQKCPECEGILFDMMYKLFKISKMAGSNITGQDIVVPQPVFQCKECGYYFKND